MIQIKGILTEGQLNKLDKLTFYKEERLLLEKIKTWSKKTRLYIKIHFFVGILTVFGTFIALVMTSRLSGISDNYVKYFFMIFFVFSAAELFFVYIKKVHSVNYYHRIMRDLYDNLLRVILDNYRLSLAEVLPNFPNVKEISEDMGKAGLSSANYHEAMEVLTGIVLGGIVLFLYFLAGGDIVYLRLTVITFIILGFFGLFLYLGKKFSNAQQAYRGEADKFDQVFNDSEPLLVRTQIDYETSSYEKYLKKVVHYTDRVNLVSEINVGLLPVLLLFLPYALDIKEAVLSYILVGLYVSGKLFGRSLVISQKADVDHAEKRIKEVDDLLDLILSINSELTPAKYVEMKDSYLSRNNGKFYKSWKNDSKKSIIEVIEEHKGEGLLVKNLEFISGRVGQKKIIKVSELLIPSGKVSFLIGDSGIGKSVFGRLVTLRYADFNAEFLGISSLDFRLFTNLEEAHKYLHFSGLRNIFTSYRNAISVYIKNYWEDSMFVKSVENIKIDSDTLRTHFVKNSDYYGSTVLNVLRNIDEINKNIKPIYVQKENNQTYYFYLGQLFKYLHSGDLFIEMVNKCKTELSETSMNNLLVELLKTEYYAYKHMLSYIPEASLYFLDAVLSEPPISQGQRRRILYALDVFMKGKVFVVDEPFSNLDVGTSINIIKDLIKYAKSFDAVVLVLDQKIFKEVYEKFKDEFGLVLTFKSDENGSYVIKPLEQVFFSN